MSKRFDDPLFSWAIWSAFIALGFFAILIGWLPETLQADKTNMSIGILVVFCFGWVLSFLHARSLHEDWVAVDNLIRDVRPAASPECFLLKLLDNANVKLRAGVVVSANNLISAYQMRRDYKRRILTLLSSLLITMGLIGTIIGLISSMMGLNEIVMSADTTKDSLIMGLQQAMSGMGTAFFTTLYGAAFGGAMLKALAHQTHSSMISISGMAMEYLERHDVEEAKQQASAAEAARNEMNNFSTSLSHSLHQLNVSLAKARQEVDEFSSTMLNSRLAQISL